MSTFHQIGHHSFKLVEEDRLNQYSGMVCSPINYDEAHTTTQISSLPNDFISIFDPQLYYPHTERGVLKTWNYFPKDFETADQSSISWWIRLCDSILYTCQRINCTGICSPCIVPKRFSPSYYNHILEVGNYIQKEAKQLDIMFYQTAIIDIDTIGEKDEAKIIASVLSRTRGNAVYLILISDLEPRREYNKAEQLLGVMELIRLLTNSGIHVFVPYSSSEFLLWKYAGATDFATGKFFNLRRFTSSRFDEPSSGGGQLPYWFEKSLLSYLREGDLIRILQDASLRIQESSMNNPYALEILDRLANSPSTPWLALSWKKYLFDFQVLESTLTNDSIERLLKEAELNWLHLEDDGILMEEARNDGKWIRHWRIALNTFKQTHK